MLLSYLTKIDTVMLYSCHDLSFQAEIQCVKVTHSVAVHPWIGIFHGALCMQHCSLMACLWFSHSPPCYYWGALYQAEMFNCWVFISTCRSQFVFPCILSAGGQSWYPWGPPLERLVWQWGKTHWIQCLCCRNGWRCKLVCKCMSSQDE